MRCIFCKCISDKSVSVEHVVPESLGNVDHVLPRGWVCDTCNNYFASKVEKPFLDTPYGRYSRAEMGVENKRGHFIPAKGWHKESSMLVELLCSKDGTRSIGVADEVNEARWIESVRGQKKGTLYIPIISAPDQDNVTGRFIGKIAMEVLAFQSLKDPGWNDHLVGLSELDKLRNYVRRGVCKSVWPINMRRIYPQDKYFSDAEFGSHQILHEFKMLFTPAGELYGVIAIFGIEYVINMGGPELDGYLEWLTENKGKSPLY